MEEDRMNMSGVYEWQLLLSVISGNAEDSWDASTWEIIGVKRPSRIDGEGIFDWRQRVKSLAKSYAIEALAGHLDEMWRRRS
jgi:hypothetical protein